MPTAPELNLSPGETLLWTGNPPTGFRLRSSDVFLIPFSMLWAGFAFFWEATVILKGAPFFFMLWGIPFVCVGIYILVGRFFVDAWQRAGTSYAISNERIIIVSGGLGRQIKSLSLDTLTDITLTERPNGGGVITFGPTFAAAGRLAGSGWPGASKIAPPSFEIAESARSVYEHARQAQRAAKLRPK